MKSMVPRTSAHEYRPTGHTAPSGGSPVKTTGQGLAPKHACTLPSCMEIEKWQLRVFDLTPKVSDVIFAARCPSTMTVHGHWVKFVPCCFSHHVDSLSAQLSEVLLFVLSLAWQGLPLGTKGYMLGTLAYLWLPMYPPYSSHHLWLVFWKVCNICSLLPLSWCPNRTLVWYSFLTCSVWASTHLFSGALDYKDGLPSGKFLNL